MNAWQHFFKMYLFLFTVISTNCWLSKPSLRRIVEDSNTLQGDITDTSSGDTISSELELDASNLGAGAIGSYFCQVSYATEDVPGVVVTEVIKTTPIVVTLTGN